MTATAPKKAHHPTVPTDEELAGYEKQWIDPNPTDGDLTTFHRYAQPSRDAGESDAGGSYQLYLPPTYDDDPQAQFPVIYWLHGGLANSHQVADAVERIDRGIREGLMPPTIVVAPQALPIGWYVDSKDGARPIEQIIVHDLLDHIDATYRTVATAEGRTLEGFSMGGYGALHLGFKYPRTFGRLSSICPSILKDMSLEPWQRTRNTFFEDQAYYEAASPWVLARGNCHEIRQHVKVRLMSGSLDERLIAVNRELDGVLAELEIPHQNFEVEGADHEYPDIIDGIGDAYFAFWRDSAI